MSAAADYAVGIDVGTTFTAAATCRGERAEVVSLGDRGDVIPSVAYLREDGTLLVGQAAERRAVADATRVARDFKRRVGDAVPLSLGGRPHTPEALTAAIVRWVVDFVTAREGGPPGRIVLTLPASWRDHRRQLLLDAAAAAGVEGAVLRAEPVAAAIHYASRHELPPGTTIGIYDLGGGTFDATIVRRSEHGFEIIGRPQGDDRLGGIDLDTLVWDHVVGVIGQRAVDPEGAPSPAQVRAVAQLRAAAVDAKEALSYDTEAVVPVALPELMTEVRITRAEFEEMARPALLRTVEVFRRTCDAAGLKPGDLHAVLLAGGSSRIPLISQLVGHELGASVASDAHPKLATCLGAAREAVVEGRSTAAGAGPGAAAATVPAPAVAASAVAAAAATPAADDTAAAAAPGAVDAAAAPPPTEPVPDSPAAEPAAAPAVSSETAPVPAAPPPPPPPGPGPGPLPPAEDQGSPPRTRRLVVIAAAAVLLVAAVAGALLARDGSGGAAGQGGGQATTSTSTTVPETTTTEASPTTTDAETTGSTQASGGGSPASTASTTVSTTTTTTPRAGAPCDPAAGDPDCTDQSVDGTFRTITGYADCVADLGAPGGLCTDLDGDGLAGYPDSG